MATRKSSNGASTLKAEVRTAGQAKLIADAINKGRKTNGLKALTEDNALVLPGTIAAAAEAILKLSEAARSNDREYHRRNLTSGWVMIAHAQPKAMTTVFEGLPATSMHRLVAEMNARVISGKLTNWDPIITGDNTMAFDVKGRGVNIEEGRVRQIMAALGMVEEAPPRKATAKATTKAAKAAKAPAKATKATKTPAKAPAKATTKAPAKETAKAPAKATPTKRPRQSKDEAAAARADKMQRITERANARKAQNAASAPAAKRAPRYVTGRAPTAAEKRVLKADRIARSAAKTRKAQAAHLYRNIVTARV
jgi:hypothetical protein